MFKKIAATVLTFVIVFGCAGCAEKYDVSEEDSLERAKTRSMNTCVELVSSSIPHQSKSLKTNDINIVKKASNYIILPVWMVNIKYKNKMYTFAMNGQTGKIGTGYPKAYWKIVVIVLSILVAFGLVFLLYLLSN